MRILMFPILLLSAGCASAKPVELVALQAIDDVSVPVDMSSGRPKIVAQIGSAAPMAVDFDTGSQGALIARELADRLGLEEVGETMMASPFGGEPVKAKLVSLGSLSIGGLPASDITAVVIEDASFMGADPRLIIGPAQFAGKVVSLDYAGQTLSISTNAPASASPWQTLKNGLPEAEIEIGGKLYPLHIDSGNPGTLMMPKSAADDLSPKPELREVGKARTVDKEFSIYIGSVNAGAKIAGVPVTLGDVGFADVPSANLGSKGLAQFKVVIDLANNRWQLVAPNGEAPVITARSAPQAIQNLRGAVAAGAYPVKS
jgi:hypothetical protein